MTAAMLRDYTLKDLAQMAKKRGITGWHSMRKEDLIRALVRDERRQNRNNGSKRSNGNGRKAEASKTVSRSQKTTITKAKRGTKRGSTRKVSTNGSRNSSAGESNANGGRNGSASSSASRRSSTRSASSRSSSSPRGKRAKKTERPSPVAVKIQAAHQVEEQLKDLSGTAMPSAPLPKRVAPNPAPPVSPASEMGKDRVVLMVRDPYWLHVHWELSGRSIQRAQAAMAEYWHTARPVIRLMEISSGSTTSASETFVRDIEIHGGVNNWYIDVIDPPRSYRVEIGYVASNGRFQGLARSNSVTTPEPGVRDTLDHNWVDVAENCERIFALSGGYAADGATDELQEVLEERLKRPVGSPMITRYGVGADPTLNRENQFELKVDAEMIVHGSTKPGAHVTMGGEPIRLRDDGSFSIRMGLPDRRQVLPVTSSSADGMTQQTVVLAVERNTKVMEAVVRDSSH